MENKMIPLTSRMGTTLQVLRKWLDSPDSAALSAEGRKTLEGIKEPTIVSRVQDGGDLSDRDFGILTGNFAQLDIA